MGDISQLTPFTSRNGSQDSGIFESIKGFNGSNINYLANIDKWKVSTKFFNSLPTLATVPPFNPNRLSDWIDKLKSFLRGCHSLDLLIREDKETCPIQVDNEEISQFNQRMEIFSERNRALYLILDKSLSASTVNLDPKYLSLSEKIYTEESEFIGQKLYDGILFLLKGSHLWARLDTINDLLKIKLDKLGSEQQVFNLWKRQVDIQTSLQMDLQKFQKLILINALSKCKEHKTVVLQLAAMTPEELFALSSQDILNRFLASAGHLQKGSKDIQEIALYANEDTSKKRKLNDTGARVCFNCNQSGHFKAQCPKLNNVKRMKMSKVKKNGN